MKAKRLITMLIAFYLVGSALISWYYRYQQQNYIVTDDSRTMVDLAVIKAPGTGRLLSFDIRENQEVKANEVVGFVQSTQGNGARLPLVSPVSGHVLRIGANEGEVVTNGQNLLAIADLGTAYVQARLTEKESTRIRVGQTVAVTLDSAGGNVYPGVVSMIEHVTQNEVWPIISLTPPRQTPREDQLVPIRIQVQGARLIPGTHTSVKIKVGGDSDGLF
ncbi:HlyD family efflux transporter periplasmic adaptor subunit [Brevibacillus fluminis]|uniref:HlyD family efflux transporter periplasmic adaptor subunit n=1 Tax=Brevibacillus fluminis TaxID=511487 RepID=A0A3M8DC06_9BACL|nr:efflux RND transporter periplasmic adaptor subunit [Brevibacillus fluminis]RNB85161.1 HlyD family efflux transporter periplasmic adaptor subunit [Brevibacillus fluminis]